MYRNDCSGWFVFGHPKYYQMYYLREPYIFDKPVEMIVLCFCAVRH